jgi:hypothetical protein
LRRFKILDDAMQTALLDETKLKVLLDAWPSPAARSAAP